LDDWKLRDMVDFQSIRHMTETASRVLELVCYKADFVPSFDEALGELVTMSLDSTELWEGEIGTEEYAVLPILSLFLVWSINCY